MVRFLKKFWKSSKKTVLPRAEDPVCQITDIDTDRGGDLEGEDRSKLVVSY